MKTIKLLSVVLALLFFAGCRNNQTVSVCSPDKTIEVIFSAADRAMSYEVMFNNDKVILPSILGFDFENMKPFSQNLSIIKTASNNYNKTWEQPWGEQRLIVDNYNEIVIDLQEKSGDERKIQLLFRVFNDGFGFKYIIPEQKGIDSIIVIKELTEFLFANEQTTWSIPAYDPMKYELLYRKDNLETIDTAHTPVTMKSSIGNYFSIHEAALVDFPSLTLYSKGDNCLGVDLVPWKDGVKVKSNKRLESSWRTVQLATNAPELLNSRMILNLNEPNVLGDVSWVKPMKYIGIWWGMHIDEFSFGQGPIHGATTERAKQYIDFAAKHGFDEVLIEGWNYGFDGNWGGNFSPEMNFTQPTADYDWDVVLDYAKKKKIFVQMYNETCANTENYLSQIDSAYKLYQEKGYRSAKVGQVNDLFANGEWHTGQYGVSYYQTVVEKAAKHKIAINFHEPVKPTGLRRTYPNLVSREGARGQEFNAWDKKGGNPPNHTCILPYTRLLAGPMDFTPGIFRIDIPQRENNQVTTTLAKQLALYVVIYSPIQMAADLIENYENQPAFQFIKDVPVDWETSLSLDGEIGEFVVIARKERSGDEWFLGAITNEKARELSINLDFLDENVTYEAQIYRDAANAHYKTNPMEYLIEQKAVNNKTILDIKLSEGGGAAIRFKPVDNN